MGQQYLTGKNTFRANDLGRENQRYLGESRDRMFEADMWLNDPGMSGANAAAGEQFAQASRAAAQQRASGPMAAQAGMRDVAAAYGGGARAAGGTAADEYGARRDAAMGNVQSLYEGDIASYRTAAEAFNEQQRINREIAANNAARGTSFGKKVVSGVTLGLL